MAWAAQNVTVWRVCWKWGFIPYPCRKTVTKFCCTGTHKWRVWGVLKENYSCCEGNESHWFDAGWFVGLPTWHLGNKSKCAAAIAALGDRGLPELRRRFPDG